VEKAQRLLAEIGFAAAPLSSLCYPAAYAIPLMGNPRANRRTALQQATANYAQAPMTGFAPGPEVHWLRGSARDALCHERQLWFSVSAL